MPKSRVGKPVRIDWEDAWTNGSRWEQKEIDETKPMIMSLYGYCVRDDKVGMTVTMEHANPPSKGDFRCIWHVPRGMIRKVTVLK